MNDNFMQIHPYMSEEQRHKLENEAKSWLQIQTTKAAVEIKAGKFNLSKFTLKSF
jgi:hypothetical protein